MTERRYQWAGQFQLGLKVTDWVFRADGVQTCNSTQHAATFSAPDTHSVLPGASFQQQPSPPHKTAPAPSFHQTGPGWKTPRSTLLSTPAAPFLLFPFSTPSSQIPPYPPRTVLLSVSCLHGNNRGQVLGEEASGKCSFLRLPWVQFPNHHHYHSVLHGKVSELKS